MNTDEKKKQEAKSGLLKALAFYDYSNENEKKSCHDNIESLGEKPAMVSSTTQAIAGLLGEEEMTMYCKACYSKVLIGTKCTVVKSRYHFE